MTHDEITEVKVIYDDRPGAIAGWFARAYNESYPLPDEWLEAETEQEAVTEAREIFGWPGNVAVYSSILSGVPSAIHTV